MGTGVGSTADSGRDMGYCGREQTSVSSLIIPVCFADDLYAI